MVSPWRGSSCPSGRYIDRAWRTTTSNATVAIVTHTLISRRLALSETGEILLQLAVMMVTSLCECTELELIFEST